MQMASPLTPRKQPSQERARATVDAVLDAAAHILESDDTRLFTTNHVARRAGVSIGSLYQYFPNKWSILDALAQRFRERIVSDVERILAAGTDGPLEAVARETMWSLGGAYSRGARLHRVLFHDLGPRAGLTHAGNGASERLCLCAAHLLRARRDLSSEAAASRAHVLVGTLQAYVHATLESDPLRLATRAFVEGAEGIVATLVRRA
jgi:AcrR family transcriptional regulator